MSSSHPLPSGALCDDWKCLSRSGGRRRRSVGTGGGGRPSSLMWVMLLERREDALSVGRVCRGCCSKPLRHPRAPRQDL